MSFFFLFYELIRQNNPTKEVDVSTRKIAILLRPLSNHTVHEDKLPELMKHSHGAQNKIILCKREVETPMAKKA